MVSINGVQNNNNIIANNSTVSDVAGGDPAVNFASLLNEEMAAQSQATGTTPTTTQPQLSSTVINDFEKLLSDLNIAPDKAKEIISELQDPTKIQHHHRHHHTKKPQDIEQKMEQELAMLLQQLSNADNNANQNTSTSSTSSTTSAAAGVTGSSSLATAIANAENPDTTTVV